ncbi:hypothetical protein GOQ27_16190 [Clostridium sp. D2Q-11]|uniref:Uncharacterized protein n=1 Tax=Anaeromonas frigoriresistens TaxID=2683708 RepID=A0A942UVW1_9FIRM|nr:hypothetical protein [Anaeromonas frigoriresistens]MBS4540018.1 hypothetical protein [Anaeromonas frigoriresistens]
MADKQSKKREYLHLYSFISDKGDAISFRLNPDEEITEELFHKYENSHELSEEELNKYLISELENTIYINYEEDKEKFDKKEIEELSKNEKAQLLNKVAKIREADIK